MRKYQQIVNLLESLKLKGMIPNLDSEITEAEEKKISYLSFLDLLLKAEIDYRTERKLKRNLAGAHFPVEKDLDNFQFARVKVSLSQIYRPFWISCGWIIIPICCFLDHPAWEKRI